MCCLAPETQAGIRTQTTDDRPPRMTSRSPTILACTCQDTVAIDGKALAAGCSGARVERFGSVPDETGRLISIARDSADLVIACSCRRSEVLEALEEAGIDTPVAFADIREPAGWSSEGKRATPKMAALIALASLPPAETPMVTLDSDGVALIYGRDETALTVARRLADDLDITVLLSRPGTILPPRQAEYPIFSGTIATARGHLGAFELTVDGFAAQKAAARGPLAFGPARNGARSSCDILIDVSGGAALVPAHDLRPGYLRADPASPASIEALIAEARDLAGTFDKPRYVTLKPELCAHSRSSIVGCTRCIEVCPTGAISPAGDSVAVDHAICAGCGGCGAVCPTGAASYAVPAPDAGLSRLRSMLTAFHAAGGAAPALLVHDGEHGADLIHALAHAGDGLPARVIPVPVNEITQLGLEWFAGAFAYGAAAVRVLTRTRPRHDISALDKTLALAGAILSGLGFAEGAVGRIDADDPDALAAALGAMPAGPAVADRASFLPVGGKRPLLRLALSELHVRAPRQTQTIALPAGAPMGRVVHDAAGCTLCLACVSACPAEALRANPDRPELSFIEDRCVQCGLCARTCPEKVITIEPRLDFAAIAGPAVILKQEDPHACERCGKAFGTKATIARIRAKLADKHWMFTGANADRAALIGLCDDCRVIAATERAIDPYAGTPRPKPRTAEDYLRDREGRDRNGDET